MTGRPSMTTSRCTASRVIHGRAEGHQRAPVMTHHREPVVAYVPHQRHHVIGHRPLGRLRMPGRIRRQRGLPVAAQIRADHEERARRAQCPAGYRRLPAVGVV